MCRSLHSGWRTPVAVDAPVVATCMLAGRWWTVALGGHRSPRSTMQVHSCHVVPQQRQVGRSAGRPKERLLFALSCVHSGLCPSFRSQCAHKTCLNRTISATFRNGTRPQDPQLTGVVPRKPSAPRPSVQDGRPGRSGAPTRRGRHTGLEERKMSRPAATGAIPGCPMHQSKRACSARC